MITLVAFDRLQIHARQREIVQVYRQAFRVPPYTKREAEVAEFQASLPHHVQRDGFAFLVALTGEWLVGFADGNTTNASHLYRRRGWIVLLVDHYFPGVDRPPSILGLDLRARAVGGEMRGSDGTA